MKFFSSLKKQATGFLERYKQESPATYAAAEQALGAILITDGLIGIDNPFGGNKRPGIFGALAAIISGVAFLFIPTFMGNVFGTNSMTATTSATVVSTGTNAGSTSDNSTCSLVAHYVVDGTEYTNRSSVSSGSNCSVSVGQSIPINYNPANPASWAYDTKTLGILLKLFFWVGVITIIAGFTTFVIRLLSIIFGWKLLRDGRKLAATLPQGTNLQTIIDEIKQNFVGIVFNFDGTRAALSSTQTTQKSMPDPAVVLTAQTHTAPVATSPVAEPIQTLKDTSLQESGTNTPTNNPDKD